ncbi:MAG: sigma 54-interacting transcriptional regulator, partial [Oscillospiraceae bacterium]
MDVDSTCGGAAPYGGLDFLEVCQHLYDGIHITDGEGRILFINSAYTRTTGIRPDQVLGRTVAEIEGLLYKGSVTEQVLRTRQRVNSVATILELGKEVLVTGTPVFAPDGEIKLVVTNTRDFPELKRLESQLHDLTVERKKADQELAFLRRQQAGGRPLVYRSEAMESVMELVRTVAQTDVTVLITGESGTGKELIANELYQNSARRGRPFIKVNCAAIPAELLESELFGYEEGAFTGARRSGRAGMFELADTGVILLDEIGDMPLPLQTKLLRVLQQRELMRVGATRRSSLMG